MEKINKCRVCDSKKIKQFLDLGKQPLANAFLKSPKQKERKYPLSLSYCLDCSLVQLNHTVDPKELFSNYLWVTGTAQSTKKYAQEFAKDVSSRVQGKPNVLEIGSNDGTFLKAFQDRGHGVLGIDPAKNIVKEAINIHIPTLGQFFGVRLAKNLDTFKIVVARNVLYHVANIHDFVEGLRIVLDNNGLLVLEVHYARKGYEELHYDSIYHEHLFYYTIKSLEKLLNKHDLYIQDLKESPINAGNLVIYARKGPTKEKPIVQEYRLEEQELGLNSLTSWLGFADRVEKHRRDLNKMLVRYWGSYIVGFGASAKSSTLLNYSGIYLEVIADDNPLKQNLYTPGTHILVKSTKEVMNSNPDVILITAWNFKDEIIKRLRKEYKYKGKFVIPLPNKPYEI